MPCLGGALFCHLAGRFFFSGGFVFFFLRRRMMFERHVGDDYHISVHVEVDNGIVIQEPEAVVDEERVPRRVYITKAIAACQMSAAARELTRMKDFVGNHLGARGGVLTRRRHCGGARRHSDAWIGHTSNMQR